MKRIGEMTAADLGLPPTAWTRMKRYHPAALTDVLNEAKARKRQKGLSAAEFKRRELNRKKIQRAEKGSALRQHLSETAAQGVPGARKLLKSLANRWERRDSLNINGCWDRKNSKPGPCTITRSAS